MAGANRKPGRGSGHESVENSRKATTKPGKIIGSRVKDEVWAVIILAIGAFLIIALHTKAAGKLGEAVADLFFGTFGFAAFFLPYYLILYCILLFAKRAAHVGGRSALFLVLIYLMLSIINASRFVDAENISFNLIAIFNDSVERKSGGVFGMYAGNALVKFVGRPGLYIFSAAVIIVSLLLVVNTPISQFLDRMKLKRAERNAEAENSFSDETQEQGVAGEPHGGNGAPPPKSHLQANAANPDAGPRAEAGIDSETRAAAIIDREPPPPLMSESQIKILSYMKDESLFERGDENGADSYSEEGLTLDDVSAPRRTAYPIEDEIKTNSRTVIERLVGADAGRSSTAAKAKYQLPPLEHLNKSPDGMSPSADMNLKSKAAKLEETLRNFNVDAKIVQVTQGPAVTRYEIQPNIGVKVSKIVGLADDIALNLEARSIRIEAPIPGKAAVGIEVENDKVQMVTLRDILSSKEFRDTKSKIAFAVGKDISGNSIVADLKSMPHMLIAGATGSGKSVCINSIIISILYKAAPDEVKLVMIDPKVVELGNYNGIPHLLIPVVTEPSKAAAALSWAVSEMTDRYKKFEKEHVKNLESFNEAVRKKKENDRVLPQIVIVIDELADLMMAAPSQVEESICRLAQMARAAGMHLIVATQRPSVDIITGVIKANIPSRIAFAVSSQFDSRTILDMAGAEKLVGKGDMLFNPIGIAKPVRVQGTFVSDSEVHKVIEFVKSQTAEAEYAEDVMHTIERGNAVSDDDRDDLLPEAVEFVVRTKQASASGLQRRFRIGYNRAARMIEMMEARGIVSRADGSRPRQVLIDDDELDGFDAETKGMQ